MDKIKVIFRLTPVALMAALLLAPTAQSLEKPNSLWNEAKDSAPVKIFTPDLYVDVAERYNPAVVNISTVENVKNGGATGRGMEMQPFSPQQPFGGPSPFDDLFRGFMQRMPRELKRQALGSGFILNPDGYIVTNNHVVEHADEITVVLSNEDTLTAKVIGRDPKTDIALIKIDYTKKLPLKSVILGDSDKMRVGDMVIAIGNPFGLDHTMTTGIISARGRSIGLSNMGGYEDFLQTDASINPGNSGGPLLNLKGEVIGINTAINAAGQGIGFAIPINMAKDILSQLKGGGKVVRGWLGVYITKMDRDLATQIGLEKPAGAVVTEVQPGSPAEKAQLQRGDVVVAFNGKAVNDFNDLPRMVAATSPGAKVSLEVLREKSRLNKNLTLGELPGEELMAGAAGSDEANSLGLEVQELTPEISRSLGLSEKDKGILIVDVDPDSAAASKGLRRGDVILEINKVQTRSLKEFKNAVKTLKPKTSVLIWAKRGNRTFYVPLTVGAK